MKIAAIKEQQQRKKRDSSELQWISTVEIDMSGSLHLATMFTDRQPKVGDVVTLPYALKGVFFNLAS